MFLQHSKKMKKFFFIYIFHSRDINQTLIFFWLFSQHKNRLDFCGSFRTTLQYSSTCSREFHWCCDFGPKLKLSFFLLSQESPDFKSLLSAASANLHGTTQFRFREELFAWKPAKKKSLSQLTARYYNSEFDKRWHKILQTWTVIFFLA